MDKGSEVTLPSIRELEPYNLGGRYARKGFQYQDHIGASLCLQLVLDNDLKEVWFETHDDIVLIYSQGERDIIEFVQVKNEDKESRWSVSALASTNKIKDDSRPYGKSIVETSIGLARCSEECRFRIVTSVDVNKDLGILKYHPEHPYRLQNSNQIRLLSDQIVARVGNIASPNGLTIHDWVCRCQWKCYPNLTALENENKLLLESICKSFGQTIFSDHRDEVYSEIVSQVFDASNCDYFASTEKTKFKKADFSLWLQQTLMRVINPRQGNKTIERKMKEACIEADTIDMAIDLRFDYARERLNTDFVKASDLRRLEMEVKARLNILKNKLDSKEIEDNGTAFHLLCLKDVQAIADSICSNQDYHLSALAQGFMYELTSRCPHRFSRVKR